MKIFVLILAVLMTAEFSLADVPPNPLPVPRTQSGAVEVDFFGGLTGYDKSAYRAVKSLVASLISDGVIDQLKTTFWGREGGSSFCVELSRDAKMTPAEVVQLLGAVHPRDDSVYKVVIVEKCQ